MFLISYSYSQNIGIDYNSTGAGKNITATFSKEIKRSELGLGLGFNINSIKQTDDQSNIFYKRLYATKPIHYLNINIFYNRRVFANLQHIEPFVFYDLQMKYSTTRSSMFMPYAFDSTIVSNSPDDKVLYRNYIRNYGPFYWIENAIGIGFKVNIYDKLDLQQKIGFGGYFI